jgi:carbamoylphosphate synthase small subunit
MLGKITVGNTDPESIPYEDPNKRHLVAEVSINKPVVYNPDGEVKIVAVHCGMKINQIRLLCERGACVKVVPWDYKLDSSGKQTEENEFYLYFCTIYINRLGHHCH